MNTSKLEKNYRNLTAWQRLALLIDARRRNDDLELHRLRDSAPCFSIQVFHQYFAGQAFWSAMNAHAIQMRELAAKFWIGWACLGWLKRKPATSGKKNATTG